MTHPITPPPGLVEQWVAEACPECRLTYDEFTGESVEILAARAAQWGADQELEACCEWLKDKCNKSSAWPDNLLAARRPKPPSLKEQALEDLASIETNCGHLTRPETLLQSRRVANIRRALNQLPDS